MDAETLEQLWPPEERKLHLDPELPAACRLCELDEGRTRIPGQFYCPTCAQEKWVDHSVVEVIEEIRAMHEPGTCDCDWL